MRILGQIGAVTWNGLSGIRGRLVGSLVVVAAGASVVAVLVSVLAMADGLSGAVHATGRPNRAIVLRGGSNSELSSTLTRDAVHTVESAPGVRHDAAGKALVSAEVLSIVPLATRSGSELSLSLRGVGPDVQAVRPELKILAGRMMRPGIREVIVGRATQTQFPQLQVGGSVTLGGATWRVVGIFSSGGDAHESEVLTDAGTLMTENRHNLFQSVTVALTSAEAFQQFKDALSANPSVSLEISRESDFYARQSRQLIRLLFFVAYAVGAIMATGASLAALNSMYASVRARAVEIATLRAIGFATPAAVLPVVAEAVLLALAGGAIGAALAWAAFNGYEISTRGSSITQVVFPMTVSFGTIGLGMLWAGTVGLVGCSLPALRAATAPVATALRAV